MSFPTPAKIPYDHVLEAKLAPMLLALPGATKIGEQQIVVPTRLGRLRVHIFDDWVGCRFLDDLEPARKHFGVRNIGTAARLNPFSGKWNFEVGADVFPRPKKTRNRWPAAALKTLADIVWREVQDLTVESVAKEA